MKFKIIFIPVVLLILTNCLYSQDTIGKKEKAVLKPITYDSTKFLEEQFKTENQFEFIGLQLFLPPVINPEVGPIVFSKRSNDFVKGNKYYTVIDILQGDITKQLKEKNVTNQCGYQYKNIDSLQLRDLIIFGVFVLKETDKIDSLNDAPLYWVACQSKRKPYSCSNFNSFISSPYFEKQKQIYQKQDIINLGDKSKWFCKEVTLLKSLDNDSQDSIYDVFCVLINNKGEQMQLRPPSEKFGRSFMTEKEYTWLDHAAMGQKEQYLKAIADKKEKYRSECVNRFGQHKGELIAQGKIEIGMTAEMCKVAWGAPWDISKTITKSIINEIWFYNWNYKLYFENSILVKIEH